MSRNIKAKKKGPIRIVIQISSTGARLTVPLDGITLNSTLSDVISTIELPQLSPNATLVCLRKVSICNEWGTTTLKEMLAGDDGSAGVLLTLDLGSGAPNCGAASKSIIEKAAAALNIKPEPMDVSDAHPTMRDVQQNATQQSNNLLSSQQAWSAVLSSNFDTTSKACLMTLLKIIDNILSRDDPKVRSIRYGNPNFQQKVVSCKGALEFMYSLGFEGKFAAFGSTSEPESLELINESRDVLSTGREVLILSAKKDFGMADDDLPKISAAPIISSASTGTTTVMSAASTASNRSHGFDIYKGHSINITAQQMGAPDPYANKSLSTTERQLQNLEAKKKNLEKKIQDGVEMDRCLAAYLPGQGPSGMASSVSAPTVESKGDSSLVAARMKRMEEERKKREEGGFTTKAMRDLEKMKKAKVYSHAQIRINFPDGTHLHAKFLPTETISAVRAIIQSSFNPNTQLDFELYVAPPRRLLNDDKSLEDEELVPAAKIHVGWKSNLGNMPVGGFLRSELFNANKNTASFPEAKPIVPEKKAPPSASSSNVSNNDTSQSKEDLLMARMMGKGPLGGKKKSSDAAGDGDKKGKPKWFK